MLINIYVSIYLLCSGFHGLSIWELIVSQSHHSFLYFTNVQSTDNLTNLCVLRYDYDGFMKTVSYTISRLLSDDLAAIDILRNKLLTIPINPRIEYLFRWNALIETIYGSFVLSKIPITRTEIEVILSKPRHTKTPTSTAVDAYANAYRWITQHWSGSPLVITHGDIEVLATLALSQPHRTHEAFSLQEKEIGTFCKYLTTQNDHPVVSAGLAHAYFLHTQIGAQDLGKIARLTSSAYMAQSGYDIRGMNHPESIWAHDPKAYDFALSEALQLGQLTPWLEFIAASTKESYIHLTSALEKTTHGIPSSQEQSIAMLSNRQLEILEFAALPNSKLTNRTIQTRFRISAITASRDLARLAAIGQLYAHGKGRSVYYTRT